MKRLVLTLLLCASVADVRAQQPKITIETQTTPELLQEWLGSGDSRLQAWGAYFAHKTHDQQALRLIEKLLQTMSMPSSSSHSSYHSPQRRAVLALLDALIEEGATASVETLNAVAYEFPTQALILSKRLPEQSLHSQLRQWSMWDSHGSYNQNLLARAAVMMMADKSDPDIVERIVSGAEEQLTIYIVPPNAVPPGGMGGGACGDSLSVSLPGDWPTVQTYEMAENDSAPGGELLVRVGDDWLSWRRHEFGSAWGSCNGVRPLDAFTRHQMIAYWLGVREDDMPWQPEKIVSIVWKDQADYQATLGAKIEGERRLIISSVLHLEQRGLLHSKSVAQPKIVVKVLCAIDPCPLLP